MNRHRSVGERERRVMAAVEPRERLVAFAEDVFDAFDRSSQRVNGELYLRGLIEQGPRKSLQPTLFRLGESGARYESMQQFLADSPWSADDLLRRVAERVAPRLGVTCWVVDDTGFPKDGRRSPGVKRQYSGTLGKIGNCQIGVSLHAVGERGTLPLGWSLYLPADWCDDAERRRRAKIPDDVRFQTKAQLAAALIGEAVAWEVPRGPILADQAYGDDSSFRVSLDEERLSYVVAVSERTTVYDPETEFSVPARAGSRGRPTSVVRADREPIAVTALAASLPAEAFETLVFGESPTRVQRRGRFACVRVFAVGEIRRQLRAPRSEWLIIEWPDQADAPTDYWLSNLPLGTAPVELARLARLRWTIELDYRQLKGELGLDHYEGRSWAGWHHHTALVTCAHAFLTKSASTQKLSGRPDPARSRAAATARPRLLGRPLPHLPPTRRPQPTRPLPPTRMSNKALLSARAIAVMGWVGVNKRYRGARADDPSSSRSVGSTADPVVAGGRLSVLLRGQRMKPSRN
jgi:SRSO17 transposase